MRLSRQIDEAAGFWAEAFADGLFDVAVFIFFAWWRVAVLILAYFTWAFCSWAEMRVKHDHDEYFYAWAERVEWRAKHIK